MLQEAHFIWKPCGFSRNVKFNLLLIYWLGMAKIEKIKNLNWFYSCILITIIHFINNLYR